MKPIIISAALLCVLQLRAIEPAKTYTFADPCTPHVILSAVPETYGCYTFTAGNSLLPGQTAGTYEWAFGDGHTGTGTIIAHCYGPVSVTTVFTGTLNHVNPMLCGVVPTHVTFTISLPPVPTGSCILDASEVLRAGNTVSVQGGITIPEMMRAIDFGEGGGYENTTTHTYTGCGTFVITEKTWDMNFPDDICYAYTGLYVKCQDIPTGLPETRRKSAGVYPNPCTNELLIQADRRIARITVIDILGKEQPAEYRASENGLTVNTGNLHAGAFFVKIQYLDNTEDFVKVIRQ